MVFTTTSDCQLAREMLLQVAREAIGEYVAEAQLSCNTRTCRLTGRRGDHRSVNAGSLEFTVDYVVHGAK